MMCFRFRDVEFISFEIQSFVEVHLWTFERSDFSLFFQSPYKGQKRSFSKKSLEFYMRGKSPDGHHVQNTNFNVSPEFSRVGRQVV